MCLVELEWLQNVPSLDFDYIVYEPFVTIGRKIAKDLKENKVRIS